MKLQKYLYLVKPIATFRIQKDFETFLINFY
jgi:hypothetical protein